MLKIRLQRFGKKHQPTFRVVLTDSRNSTKSGKLKEVLGWRDPRAHTHALKRERILHWLGKGAQASGTVHNLLVSERVIEGAKINVSPSKRGLHAAPSNAPAAFDAADSTHLPAETSVQAGTNAEKTEAKEVVAATEQEQAGEAPKQSSVIGHQSSDGGETKEEVVEKPATESQEATPDESSVTGQPSSDKSVPEEKSEHEKEEGQKDAEVSQETPKEDSPEDIDKSS